MRVNKILVRRTSESLPPNPSMADWTISKHLRAWAAALPFAIVLPSGPSGAVPVTAMIAPLRTAREIPTFGSNGDPVETRWRAGSFMLGLPLSLTIIEDAGLCQLMGPGGFGGSRIFRR